ncbi:MAG TPA: diaminopimelate epimerase [Candidatus Baltobacteraceae bacterium]
MLGVPVTKMHGTYNDFVVLDTRRIHVTHLPEFARFACDRHAALGADGLLVIEESPIFDARMRVINADGSEAEMCGNGMRCVARYLAEAGQGDRLTIDTLSGPVSTEVLARAPEFVVRMTLGEPVLEARDLPFARAQFVVMGNPHVVIFEDDIDAIDLPAIAQAMQGTAQFPDGVNVHLARATGPQALRVRHWERGVGLTQSCGTGAVSCAVAAISLGLVRSPVEVTVPGGRLTVDWSGSGRACMSGPAVRVLDGELFVDDALL